MAPGLGVGDPIEAEFYKLLLYDAGSFFVSHRDTEKSPGMFATLVIVLPSHCEGGELLVRHRGREARLDLRCDDPAEASFAAFYADCPHEVLPITAGCRLTLVYNLLRHGRGKLPEPPDYNAEQVRAAEFLRAWSETPASLSEDEPLKLVHLLEHAYTPAELGFHTLKGADAAAASVLAAASRRSGCELHLALLTREESGSADYTGYSRHGRRHNDDDDDDGFEASEIGDRSTTLSEWRRLDGNPTLLGEIPVHDSEFLLEDAFAELEPDEIHFQEATGNAGASFERTYRRAALVIWPQDRTFAVLCQAGLAATLPFLEDMVQRWAADGADPGAPLHRDAHELAGHMIAQWPKPGWHPRQAETPTDLDFIELRGIGERVCGAFPELAWNFDNIPAGPGHARNLLLPDLAANRGDGIAEGAVRLGIPGRGSGRERHTGGQVVRPEGDEREQSEQSRGGAHDREV